MKLEQRTVTTIVADEGKLLRRKSDGWVAGEQLTLGYNYYESGVGLAAPKLELPDDYEEIDKPEDYEEQPVPIDHAARLKNMLAIEQQEKSAINSYGLTDDDARALKNLYPNWQEDIDVLEGQYYNCDEHLWKVLTDHHTSMATKPVSFSTMSASSEPTYWYMID